MEVSSQTYANVIRLSLYHDIYYTLSDLIKNEQMFINSNNWKSKWKITVGLLFVHVSFGEVFSKKKKKNEVSLKKRM